MRRQVPRRGRFQEGPHSLRAKDPPIYSNLPQEGAGLDCTLHPSYGWLDSGWTCDPIWANQFSLPNIWTWKERGGKDTAIWSLCVAGLQPEEWTQLFRVAVASEEWKLCLAKRERNEASWQRGAERAERWPCRRPAQPSVPRLALPASSGPTTCGTHALGAS